MALISHHKRKLLQNYDELLIGSKKAIYDNRLVLHLQSQ